MSRAPLLTPLSLLLAALSAAGSAASVGCKASPQCTPGSASVSGEATFPATVDAFCQVDVQSAAVTPHDATVVPYDLNTPLFSDYAVKYRTVWLPPGAKATYDPQAAFTFPVGTVLTKSFGWPADFRDPSAPVHWAETRVLVNTAENGWTGASYEWNEAQTVATLTAGGDVLSFSFISAEGATESPNYLVPSQAQCRKCHANDGAMTTLGPSAAQLDRTYAYATGANNELAEWTKLGILSGAPSPSAVTPLPVWNDTTTGTTEQRARAYLQANCAYCHNGNGEARTTGLVLLDSETNPATYGVCKAPVAAGKAAENQQYDVVPGQPSASILIYRVTSTLPSIAMPELGRSLEHVEGVQLLSDWVTGLPGSCP
jgi:uncharacterized repeat protein (TIGR03806 family)